MKKNKPSLFITLILTLLLIGFSYWWGNIDGRAFVMNKSIKIDQTKSNIIVNESKEINLYQSSLDICMMRGMEGLLNKNLASASAAVRQVNMNVKQIDSLRNQDASEAAALNTLDK